MPDGAQHEVAEHLNALLSIFSRKLLAGIVAVLLLGGAGTTFLGNVASNMTNPPKIKVESPQMKNMIDDSLEPLQELMTTHYQLDGHPRLLEKYDSIAIDLTDIEKSMDRQDKKVDRIADNLAETTEVLNRLSGQVEILVMFQTERLGLRSGPR